MMNGRNEMPLRGDAALRDVEFQPAPLCPIDILHFRIALHEPLRDAARSARRQHIVEPGAGNRPADQFGAKPLAFGIV